MDKRSQVDALIEAHGFHGELSTKGLLELVQLVLMTTPDGALHVQSSAELGTLWFAEGEIVHAEVGRERGASAFQRMLRWRGGRFSVDTSARAAERSIRASTTELLLESARLLDEEGRGAASCGAAATAEGFAAVDTED